MIPANLPPAVRDETLDLFFGRWLGSGQYRDVYVYSPDETKVVKIERNARSFSNVSEWQIWQEVKDTKWARYFAACSSISHSGSVLVMERTRPLERAPTQLPNFMADLKTENFGRVGSRIVCHDYGISNLMWRGLTAARMTKVNPKDFPL